MEGSRPAEPVAVSSDPWVYRLAIGGVSGALVAYLIAGAIVGATGHASTMNKEFWTLGAALAGALVGIIAPSPRQKQAAARQVAREDRVVTLSDKVRTGVAPVSQPLLLIVTIVLSLWLASEFDAADGAVLRTLAAGAAGGLLGLLVPSSSHGGGE